MLVYSTVWSFFCDRVRILFAPGFTICKEKTAEKNPTNYVQMQFSHHVSCDVNPLQPRVVGVDSVLQQLRQGHDRDLVLVRAVEDVVSLNPPWEK